MTGYDLRDLVRNKWGYAYDVQLRKTPNKIYLQVMWKYQEQASFPLSEEDYLTHLDSIGNYLSAMGAIEQVVEFVAATNEKPRLGKAVSIPLDLGDRAAEWLL